MSDLSQAVRRLNRRHKYGAKAQVVDGYRFASQLETKRYGELKLLEKAGEIRELTVHPRYEITVNGRHICTYIADFSYFDVHRETLRIEDTKGARTALFLLKKKLMKACLDLEVEEVR